MPQSNARSSNLETPGSEALEDRLTLVVVDAQESRRFPGGLVVYYYVDGQVWYDVLWARNGAVLESHPTDWFSLEQILETAESGHLVFPLSAILYPRMETPLNA